MREAVQSGVDGIAATNGTGTKRAKIVDSSPPHTVLSNSYKQRHVSTLRRTRPRRGGAARVSIELHGERRNSHRDNEIAARRTRKNEGKVKIGWETGTRTRFIGPEPIVLPLNDLPGSASRGSSPMAASN